MTMFAEPLLSSSAGEGERERMECRAGEQCRPRDYHHYPQHHDTPDHLRDKSYAHYSDTEDREVGQKQETGMCAETYRNPAELSVERVNIGADAGPGIKVQLTRYCRAADHHRVNILSPI